MNSQKVHYWIEAMLEEMDSLKENIFRLTALSEGKNVMSGR